LKASINIMVGTPADSIVAEAVVKGFHGFDSRLAYKAVYKDAMTPPEAIRLIAGTIASRIRPTRHAQA